MPHVVGKPICGRRRDRHPLSALHSWGRPVSQALIVAALQTAGLAHAFAQEPAVADSAASNEDYAWVGAGVGLGSEDFAGSANFSYQHGAHLLSLRVAGTTGLFEDGFGDVAILYGRSTRPRGGHSRAALGLGIGLAHGCKGGGIFASCVKQPTVVGLPLEAHLAWLPLGSLGVGLYGFANFNRIRSIAGVTLGIQLGDVR